MRLWATSSSWRCLCLLQQDWTRGPLKVPWSIKKQQLDFFSNLTWSFWTCLFWLVDGKRLEKNNKWRRKQPQAAIISLVTALLFCPHGNFRSSASQHSKKVVKFLYNTFSSAVLIRTTQPDKRREETKGSLSPAEHKEPAIRLLLLVQGDSTQTAAKTEVKNTVRYWLYTEPRISAW